MASIGQARIDIVADASGFGSTASKEVTKALDGVADDAARIFDGIEADATGAFDAVGAAASDAASDVTKSFDSAAGGAGRAGDESARGFRRGMDEISRSAAKAASDAAAEMDSSAKRSEGAWAGFASSVKGHISSAADSFKTLGSKAAGWASTHKAEAGIALGAIGGLAAATVSYASDAEQSYGAVASIFGSHADTIVAASKEAADAVGLSGNEYRELATVTGAMLKNMGMPMEEVTSRTQDLVAVGADLAATYGGSTKEAMEAVGSLLRGETDPIERYGISIKQADINARLAAEGLDKLEGEAGKQAKANVLLTMLTEQAGGAMGQFAREADTAAGKQERARARMQDMREEIGTNLLPVYASLMEIGGKIAETIGRHPKIFIAVAGAIATFAGAIIVLGTIAPIYTAISVAAGAAGMSMWGYVAAQAAAIAPALLVVAAIGAIVGAFVLLWRRSDTFREFWIGLWDTVKGVVSGAVDWVKGAFDWVKGAFEATQEAFVAAWEFMKSTWESVGRPVIDAIVTAGKWMFAIVATAVLAPLLIAWNVLSAGIKFAWETFIKPSWDALAAAATWLWETVLLPVFGFISSAWDALGAAIRWVWDNVIKVAWDLLAAGLTWLYETVVLFYVDLIKRAWDGLGAMVMWVWENVIKKAWDALAAGLTWLWDNVVNPVLGWISDRWAQMGNALHSVWEWISDKVFGALGRGLDGVKSAFQVAVDAITRIWDGVKKAAAAPVKFVIDTVWNNGILKAWNAVAGLVGLDTQDNITHDLGGYATGGIVPGARSVGRDNMRFISEDGSASIGLAGGEGIAHQHVVDAIGKRNWIALNKRAAESGPSAVEEFLGGFARGGIVPSIVGLVNRFFPGMTITSDYRNTADLHGQGKAVDFSNGGNAGTPQMKAAARFFYDNYAPMLAELIHWPLAGWQNIDEGRPYDFGPATNAGHRNHVHVAAHSPLPEPGSPITPIASGGGGGFFQSIVDVVKGLWDSAIGKIGKWTEGGGEIAALPGAFLKKAGSLAWDFVKEKAESIGGWFTGGGSATQWASVASEALRRHGYGDEHLDRTLRQIQIESNGDPSAINLTDSNARRGTPSKGLLQVIDPTYRRIRARYASAFAGLPDNIWDPLTNVTAGVGAVRADWGGPGARWPTKDGYHKGGLMGEGDGWFHKTALEPEMILSPAQTEAFIDWMRAGIPDSGDVASRFAGEVVDLLGAREARTYPVRDERGGGGSTRIVQVTQNIYGSDSASDSAGRIIDLLDRWN